GNSISLFSAPSIYISMLWPLILATLGYSAGFAAIVLARLRAAVVERRIAALLLARASAAERSPLVPTGVPSATPAEVPAR
ncbi:MAG: heme ABC transporter permease, partial [Acetobacteraceae bacterium]